MMHPGILKIAKRYEVPLADRSCYKSYVWDGSTLATYFQDEIWDDYGPLPIGIGTLKPIDDFTMLHEIAHFVVADPVEREFPEYGCTIGLSLGLGRTDPFNWGGISQKQSDFQEQFIMNVLTHEEQEFREVCADLLGCYWCDVIGIKYPSHHHPIVKYESQHEMVVLVWRAMIWLHQQGLCSNS